MSANRLIVTLLLISILFGVLELRVPMGGGVILMALFGWWLAFFGAEMAPLLGIRRDSGSDQYIEPFIQVIGWVFIFVVLGLFVALAFYKTPFFF